MEYQIDLVLRGDLIEEMAVHDVPGVARINERAHLVREWREVERDDVMAAVLRQRSKQRATDLGQLVVPLAKGVDPADALVILLGELVPSQPASLAS